jgi:pimeloyl-ACP methyl ester carboxylesterase
LTSRLPGAFDFAELTDGRCHYRIGGPADGPPLLLLHGATVPGWEFDRIVPFLNAAGFRTICPDFYGHGYSDRPHTRYDHDLFVRQAAELVDRFSPERPVDVFGHSLGAAIAARLANTGSHRIGRLVMAAPLLDFISMQPASKLLRLPVLGEALMAAYVVPMLVRRRTARYRSIEDGRFVRMFRDQFRIPGFGRALLSMIRSGALGDQHDAYRAFRKREHAALVLRGSDDRIFLPGQMQTLRRLLPDSAFVEMPGMGHPLMLTHPEDVAGVVVDFLSRPVGIEQVA